MGPVFTGRFCNARKPAVEKVWQFQARTGVDVDQLIQLQLVGGKPLDKPSVHHASQSIGEDQQRSNRSNSGSTVLASSSVVHHAPENGNRPSSPSAEQQPDLPQAGELPGPDNEPELVYSRVACLREAYQFRGETAAVIKLALNKLEKDTDKQYDRVWNQWALFAESHGDSFTTPRQPVFHDWLATLVNNGKAKKTLQSYSSIVLSTLAAINPGLNFDTGGLQTAMQTMAGKRNRQAAPKYQEIWNLVYVHQYLFSLVAKDDYYDFKTCLEFLIVAMKSTLGWRSSDLIGISLEGGVRMSGKGREFRFWNGKVGKNKWSGWSLVPRLKPAYKTLDVNFWMDKVLEFDVHKQAKQQFFGSQSEGKMQTPLFISSNKQGKDLEIIAHKVTTIKKKAVDAFLDRIEYNRDQSIYKTGFGPHSFRHAVASTFKNLGVTMEDAATFMQTGAESLGNTYAVPIRTDGWMVPLECVRNTHSLPVKLLLTFIHFTSFKNKKCACANVVA